MEYNKIKTVGVLTSGGDAPGMNAAIRAVTRAAIGQGIRVKAIYRGYKGLIDGEVEEFSSQDVSGIIQRGGTILKSARCKEFQTPEGTTTTSAATTSSSVPIMASPSWAMNTFRSRSLSLSFHLQH